MGGSIDFVSHGFDIGNLLDIRPKHDPVIYTFGGSLYLHQFKAKTYITRICHRKHHPSTFEKDRDAIPEEATMITLFSFPSVSFRQHRTTRPWLPSDVKAYHPVDSLAWCSRHLNTHLLMSCPIGLPTTM
jgi:hypothetical protein